jgi:glycosyltransferase involved in cell wall biosynthesis
MCAENTGEPERRRPSVSVCMATYNGERFLHEQLSSILSQLSDNDELVIVDDASQDSTTTVISSFADRRVRLLREKCNRGVLKTFESALREARGEIIFLADQDDVWRADKIAKVSELFSVRPDLSLVLSDYSIIDAEGNIILESQFGSNGFHGSVFRTIVRNQYQGCIMAFRRSILADCLPFPEDIPMHDMWIGVINQLTGRAALIADPLVFYRRHDRNETPGVHAPWLQMFRWRWALVRNLGRFLARRKQRKG